MRTSFHMSGHAGQQPDVEKLVLDLQSKQRTLATHADAVEETARSAQLAAVRLHLSAAEQLAPLVKERENALAQHLADAKRALEAALKREREAAAADAAAAATGAPHG